MENLASTAATLAGSVAIVAVAVERAAHAIPPVSRAIAKAITSLGVILDALSDLFRRKP